jgi:hypothetical protein
MPAQVVDFAEEVREAKLECYGYIIRDEGEQDRGILNEEMRRCGPGW